MGLSSGLDNTSIYSMSSLKPSFIYPSFTENAHAYAYAKM